MKNKQNSLLLFLLVTLLLPTVASAKSPAEPLLIQADSLFLSRRYTESLHLYDSLFARRSYSPAMLLKMAYIEEALGHVSMPLYYLSLYHLATGEEAVARKMEDFADKHRLLGYRQSDLDRAGWAYYHYHREISLMLAALALLTFSYMVYLRLARHSKPLPYAFVLLLWLGLLFLHTGFDQVNTRGIVSMPGTLLMAQPSAGGGVIEVLDEGHRIKIVGKTDRWIRVEFQGQEGYIKQDRLREVTL